MFVSGYQYRALSHKRRQVVQLLPANDGSLLRRSSRVILSERLVAFAARNKYDVNDFLPGPGGGFELLRGWNNEEGGKGAGREKKPLCPAHE